MICASIAAGILTMTGCADPIDTNLLEFDELGDIDPTTYAGLRIYGELREGEAAAPTYGPLNLVDLQVAMFTACYDEHIFDLTDKLPRPICMKRDIASQDPNNPEDECIGHVCMAHLYRCLGYKNLELAEATGVFELSTEVFSYSDYTIEDGVVDFNLIWDGSSYSRSEKSSGENYHYRIPPLSAENRTLALLAAQAAFKKAGIRSGQAVDIDGKNDCMSNLVEWSDPISRPTLMDHFATGMAESVQMLSESTKYVVQNELSVATAAKTKTNDYVKAQKEQWQGLLNSHTSAMRHIMGAAPESAGLKPVPTRVQRESQKKALNFLRETHPAGVYDLEFSNSAIISAGWKASYSQMYGVDSNEVPDPNPQTLAADRGFTISDIEVARRFLIDERNALGRIPAAQAQYQDEYGHNRVYGAQKATFQHPSAYYWKDSMGHPAMNICISTEDAPSAEYAKTGVVQALDYARNSMGRVLRKYHNRELVLEKDVADIFGKSFLGAGKIAGDRRVRALLDYSDPRSSTATIRVDGVEQGDEILLVLGDEGYRCLLEGSIDGKPCNADELNIVARSGEIIDSELLPTSMDRHIKLEGQILPSEHLHVVSKGAKGLELLGTIDTSKGEDDTRCTMFGTGRDSILGSMKDIPSFRSPDNPGEPEALCGESVDKDFLKGFVPPLQNEITGTNDALPQYESSWKHYLDLATQAATKADQLGEQLLEAGLQTDMRSETARKELEELCGSIITTEGAAVGPCEGEEPPEWENLEDQHTVCDPALAYCLPPELGGRMETMDFVSLGQPACVFRWKDSGRVCACSKEEEGKEICPRMCPISAGDAKTNEDCAAVFEKQDDYKWTEGEPGGVEFILVKDSLNVFQSETGDVEGLPDCSILDDLEDGINSGWTEDDIAEEWNTIKAESGGKWINPELLKQVAASLRIERDNLYHYTVSSGGNLLWTTDVQDAASCPPSIPWQENTERLHCYLSKDDFGDIEEWFWKEIGFHDNWDGPANNRRAWGTRVIKGIFFLNFLTLNSTTGITKPDITEEYEPTDHEFKDGLIFSQRMGDTEGKCDSTPCDCLKNPGFGMLLPSELYDNPSLLMCSLRLTGGKLKTKFRWLDTFHFDKTSLADKTGRIGQFWEYSIPNYLKYGCTPWYNEDLLAAGSTVCMSLSFMPSSMYENLLPKKIDGTKLGYQYFLTTPTTFLDSLRLACHVLRTGSWGCGTDPYSLTLVSSFNDLSTLQNQVKCAADAIHRQAQHLIFAGLPKVLQEGFQKQGMESYYPGYEGQNLQYLLAIEADLKRFKTNADGIKDVLYQMSHVIERLNNQKAQLDIQNRIGDLQMLRNIVDRAIQVASSGFGAPAAMGQAMIATAFDLEIKDLEEQAIALQQDQLLSDAMTDAANRLAELRGLLNDIAATYSSIQANLAGLKRNQNKAAEAWANMNMLDTDAAGHVIPVNTVMRRRQNTLRVRYQAAVERAKKLAYIARRAIEFRLGVDMNEMESQMTLVPPPKEWADRICTLQGFDYERIRDYEDPLFDPENEGSDSGDDYAHMYVGDYVEMLGDFVESYAIDYPFSDEDDIAVLSLREDIKQTKTQCKEPSINLLRLSGRIGSNEPIGEEESDVRVGWRMEGCSDENPDDPICLAVEPAGSDSAATCSDDFCFGVLPDIFSENPPLSVGQRVRDRLHSELTIDPTTYYQRPPDFINSGYYVQDVGVLNPGHYIFSWWDHLPSVEGVYVPAVDYKVEVTGIEEGEPFLIASDVISPPHDWEHRVLRFDISQPTTIQVRIHPSADDCYNVPEGSCDNAYGDVWLWGVQLEYADPWRCHFYEGNDCTQVPPLPYEDTDKFGLTERKDCPDYDGAVLRASAFERACVCLDRPNGKCTEDDSSSQFKICYKHTTITLPLESIEKGELIPSNNIALGNFNYRQNEVAVNLVGTNIRLCENAESPYMCNSNAFVPYTLIHQGKVPVRNWHDKTYDYDMPTAKVEHGKALAAEVLVTNPPTSTHTQLLGPYFKTGLKGRPLQGTYELRIWETPELNWDAVEDVQLILRYRYWTRMSYGD